jgi:hypothetical protein
LGRRKGTGIPVRGLSSETDAPVAADFCGVQILIKQLAAKRRQRGINGVGQPVEATSPMKSKAIKGWHP